MQNIFITGISSGIGKGLAQFYSQRGINVYGVSRKSLDYHHDNIIHAQLDLLDYQKTPFVIEKLLKGIHLDLTILNAGQLGTMSTIKDANLDEMKSIMEINLWSQKVLLDTLLDTCQMSTVLAISSGAAINGNVGWSGYSLSKAALNMLIQLYSKEFPEIKFLAFAPGLVDTAMQDYICDEVDAKMFPSVLRLQQARGTANMPTPSKFAIKFNEVLNKLDSIESGNFVDIRNI